MTAMRLFRPRREYVIEALLELLDDPDLDSGFVMGSGVFYATHCRRGNLSMDMVESVRRGARQVSEFRRLWDEAARSARL